MTRQTHPLTGEPHPESRDWMTFADRAVLAQSDAAQGRHHAQRAHELAAREARALAWTEARVAQQQAQVAARTAPIGGWVTPAGDALPSPLTDPRTTSAQPSSVPDTHAPTSSSLNSMGSRAMQFIADPEPPAVCACGGDGWYTLAVSVSDPRFGQLYVCCCTLERRAQQQAAALAALDARLGRSVQATLASCMAFAQQRILRLITWEGRRWSESEQRDSVMAALTDALIVVRATCTASAVPVAPWRWYVGPYGSGKTHLAAAIANAIRQDATVRRATTVPIAITTMRDLIAYLRPLLDAPDGREQDRQKDRRKDRRFDRALDALVAIPVLVLDGLGEEWRRSEADRTGDAPFFIDAILDVLVRRYDRPRPPLTIVTSNHRIADCVPPRHADRFAEVAVEVPVVAWSARQANAARLADAWDRGEGGGI